MLNILPQELFDQIFKTLSDIEPALVLRSVSTDVNSKVYSFIRNKVFDDAESVFATFCCLPPHLRKIFLPIFTETPLFRKIDQDLKENAAQAINPSLREKAKHYHALTDYEILCHAMVVPSEIHSWKLEYAIMNIRKKGEVKYDAELKNLQLISILANPLSTPWQKSEALLQLNPSISNLSFLNLSYIDFSYNKKIDLAGANLYGALLRSTDLSNADLRGANLQGANLSEALLSGVNLEDANLKDAILEKTIIEDVILLSSVSKINVVDKLIKLEELLGKNLSVFRNEIAKNICQAAVNASDQDEGLEIIKTAKSMKSIFPVPTVNNDMFKPDYILTLEKGKHQVLNPEIQQNARQRVGQHSA